MNVIDFGAVHRLAAQTIEGRRAAVLVICNA